MHRFSKLFTLSVLIGMVAAFGAACSSSSNSPESTVAATVNGKKIMLAEVERIIHQQSQGKESLLSAHDLAQARLQVLDSLIQREVMYQRAEQEKLLPNEDQITATINQQKQQSGMTDEEFVRQLKDQNMTNEALREEAKKELAIKSLQDKYAGKITISDREVEDFYTANKPRFVAQRGVSLAAIIVDPADNSGQGIANDAKGDAAAKAKIDAIYSQLKAGTSDFATVARAQSEDAQSLLRGGDLGFATEDGLKQAGLSKELADQLMGPMTVGSITEPKLVGNRWCIFKLQEKRLQTENLTLESQGVRQQITVELTDQRKKILDAALLQVAMAEAKIVNNLASEILNNPGNLGLRPAGYDPSKVSAGNPTPTPAATASPSPAAKATASPAK
ncbi:MAG TPA: SurA N-terminal domain-containing protein [Pyrinomonadaceae bacterium]|nr:SurA N-terminal domain-containing protein [Pyrinomonadaceae bacterium]